MDFGSSALLTTGSALKSMLLGVESGLTRALLSEAQPPLHIREFEIQFESQNAANTAVEQLNGTLSTRPGSSSEKMPGRDAGAGLQSRIWRGAC
jgi:hypothetical protein